MRRKLAALIVGGALAMASTAWSYQVSLEAGTAEVGLQDNFLDSVDSTTLGNSGDDAELGWINKIAGTNYSAYEDKYQVTAADWRKVIDAEAGVNMYALNLAGTPDYFLVKTGNLQTGNKKERTNNDDTFLFENLAFKEWAVIDLADVEILEIKGIVNLDKISHVGEVGAPVPEPGTMMLLGAGFLGLAVYGKRRRNV